MTEPHPRRGRHRRVNPWWVCIGVGTALLLCAGLTLALLAGCELR